MQAFTELILGSISVFAVMHLIQGKIWRWRRCVYVALHAAVVLAMLLPSHTLSVQLTLLCFTPCRFARDKFILGLRTTLYLFAAWSNL